MFPIGKKETILLDFIGSLGKLEWLHYQSRIEDEWINDHFEKIDRSKYPPYTSFRFEKEVPEVITLLEDAIQSYKGKVEWCMTHHPKEYGTGVNHRILPTFVKNLRVSEGMEDVNEYIENHYPDFGPIAYDDLVGLTEHVQSVFKNAGYDA
ncbi:hypothetical protein ACXGPA_17700 [Enterobacter asburiae]|jgi:hypothetical protein